MRKTSTLTGTWLKYLFGASSEFCESSVESGWTVDIRKVEEPCTTGAEGVGDTMRL